MCEKMQKMDGLQLYKKYLYGKHSSLLHLFIIEDATNLKALLQICTKCFDNGATEKTC